MRKRIFIAVLALLFSQLFLLQARPLVKSVYWTLVDDYPTNAIIDLKRAKILKLHFDILAQDIQFLAYKYVHCDENFQPSSLSEFDFLKEFNYFTIPFPARSQHTLTDYVHYQIDFFTPENPLPLLISGNYKIQVFEESLPDEVLFEVSLIVYENKVTILPAFKKPYAHQHYKSHQQIEILIKDIGPSLDLSFGHFSLTAYQNNRMDSKQLVRQPTFSGFNEMVFSNQNGFLFPGLNEYKTMDIRSLRYNIDNKSQTLKEKQYEVELYPDVFSYNPYFSTVEYDNNGYFFIAEKDKIKDAKYYGEYVHVTFTLSNVEKQSDAEIYVVGGFNQWEPTEEAQMVYDFSKKAYRCTLLVKQGYYDYTYIRVFTNEEGVKNIDYQWFNRSFYFTENDYQILLYYKTPSMRWTEIIGYAEANSRSFKR